MYWMVQNPKIPRMQHLSPDVGVDIWIYKNPNKIFIKAGTPATLYVGYPDWTSGIVFGSDPTQPPYDAYNNILKYKKNATPTMLPNYYIGGNVDWFAPQQGYYYKNSIFGARYPIQGCGTWTNTKNTDCINWTGYTVFYGGRYAGLYDTVTAASVLITSAMVLTSTQVTQFYTSLHLSVPTTGIVTVAVYACITGALGAAAPNTFRLLVFSLSPDIGAQTYSTTLRATYNLPDSNDILNPAFNGDGTFLAGVDQATGSKIKTYAINWGFANTTIIPTMAIAVDLSPLTNYTWVNVTSGATITGTLTGVSGVGNIMYMSFKGNVLHYIYSELAISGSQYVNYLAFPSLQALETTTEISIYLGEVNVSTNVVVAPTLVYTNTEGKVDYANSLSIMVNFFLLGYDTKTKTVVYGVNKFTSASNIQLNQPIPSSPLTTLTSDITVQANSVVLHTHTSQQTNTSATYGWTTDTNIFTTLANAVWPLAAQEGVNALTAGILANIYVSGSATYLIDLWGSTRNFASATNGKIMVVAWKETNTQDGPTVILGDSSRATTGTMYLLEVNLGSGAALLNEVVPFTIATDTFYKNMIIGLST